jgi:hypothetical protein
MARSDPHFRLRIQPDVKEWLRKRAAQNLRSITAEMNFLLREQMERAATTGEKFDDQNPAVAGNSIALESGAFINREPGIHR